MYDTFSGLMSFQTIVLALILIPAVISIVARFLHSR